MNQCVQVVKEVRGVNLQYVIDFVFKDDTSPSPPPHILFDSAKSITKQPSSLIESIVCDNKIIQSIKRAGVRVIKVYIAVPIPFYVDLVETYDLFIESIDEFNKRQKANGWNYKADIGETDITPFDPNHSRFLSFNHSYSCIKLLVAVSRRQFCRRVMFGKDQYTLDSYNQSIVVLGMNFDRDEYLILLNNREEMGISICEDVLAQKFHLIGKSDGILTSGIARPDIFISVWLSSLTAVYM